MIVPHQSQAGISVGNAGRASSYVSEQAFMAPGQSAMPQALNHLSRGMDKLVKSHMVYTMSTDITYI